MATTVAGDRGVDHGGDEEHGLSCEQYTAVCEWAATGNLDRVRGLVEELSSAGSKVVRPEWFTPAYHGSGKSESPLILAAQNGHLDVAEFLVNRFPVSSFLDHTAAVSFSWGSQLHHCTALNVASIHGNVAVVRLLLRAGASHSIVDCTGSTPFCEATYHGHFDVMKCLHEHGADINAPNDFGWSPLHVAASQEGTGCELVATLLLMGADPDKRTPEGYMVLHIAAAKGQLRTVNYLLQKGFSPVFCEGDSSNPDYVPSPLYLAAASGFSSVVSCFSALKDGDTKLCPPACEYDALLLLASNLSTNMIFSQKLWRRAFDVRVNNPDENFPPYISTPVMAYGGRPELVNHRELTELVANCEKRMVGGDNFLLFLELHCQALLIRERCIGVSDPQHFRILTQLSKLLMRTCQYEEAEAMLFRAMGLTEQYRIRELESGYILPQTLEAEIGRWMEHSLAPSLLLMGSDTAFIPSFGRYVKFCMKLLKVIQERDRVLHEEYGCERTTPRYFFENILLLFKLWLYCNTMPKSGSASIEECEKLGRELVACWLHLKDGSTLLSLAISGPKELEGLYSDRYMYITEHYGKEMGLGSSLRIFYSKWRFDSLLVLALLKWGAQEVINHRDCHESRNLPLHLAVLKLDRTRVTEWGEALLSTLLSHGAHPDAVNAEGKLPWEMCECAVVRAVVRGILCGPARPPALACQAAHRVVEEGLPYEHLPIPPRLRTFIRLHDRNAQL